jgi:hypothetical protein
MLEQLKSEVAEDGDFPAYAGWWSNMVRWAYYQVMRDLRQMFAPAAYPTVQLKKEIEMAAKVFSAPAEVGPAPELDFKNIDAYQKKLDEWVKKLQQWCKQNGKGSLAGKQYRTPVGDGYAEYVVFSTAPLQLVHVPSYDAYQMGAVYARGLTAKDVKLAIEWDERVKAAAEAQKGKVVPAVVPWGRDGQVIHLLKKWLYQRKLEKLEAKLAGKEAAQAELPAWRQRQLRHCRGHRCAQVQDREAQGKAPQGSGVA